VSHKSIEKLPAILLLHIMQVKLSYHRLYCMVCQPHIHLSQVADILHTST